MQTECEIQTDVQPELPPVETEVLSAQTETAPPTPAPSARKRRRRTWLGFGRDIFLYMVAYVVISGISIGPFFWVWFGAMYADGPKWIARVYMPLAILCELCPPLSRLVNAWVNWWIL